MKLVFTLLSLFTTYAVADLNIEIENVRENFNETVKVSGKFHMGIQFAGKHDFNSLYVDIPDNSNGILCVRMSSIDGVYKAELRQEIPVGTSGRTKINFSSRYANEISSLQVNELSVLTTLGESCDAKNSVILMSAWSVNTANTYPILIIRSGARIDVAHIPSIEKSEQSFKCKKFKDTNSITFDKYCELKGVPIAKLNTIEVYRKNFRKLPTKKIVVAK